jgi:hypothetical protein
LFYGIISIQRTKGIDEMLNPIEHTAFMILREMLTSKIGDKDYLMITDVFEEISCCEKLKGFSFQTTDGRFFLNLYEDGTFNIGDFHWFDGLVDY